MPHTEYAIYQRGRQWWRVSQDCFQIVEGRESVILRLQPGHPVVPVLLPHLGAHEKLLHAVSRDAGKARQARGVLVLRVYLEAVLLAHLVESDNALLVFLARVRVDVNDCMHRLPAGVHHRRTW